jgi:hypothetical protein
VVLPWARHAHLWLDVELPDHRLVAAIHEHGPDGPMLGRAKQRSIDGVICLKGLGVTSMFFRRNAPFAHQYILRLHLEIGDLKVALSRNPHVAPGETVCGCWGWRVHDHRWKWLAHRCPKSYDDLLRGEGGNWRGQAGTRRHSLLTWWRLVHARGRSVEFKIHAWAGTVGHRRILAWPISRHMGLVLMR